MGILGPSFVNVASRIATSMQAKGYHLAKDQFEHDPQYDTRTVHPETRQVLYYEHTEHHATRIAVHLVERRHGGWMAVAA